MTPEQLTTLRTAKSCAVPFQTASMPARTFALLGLMAFEGEISTSDVSAMLSGER